MVRENSASPSRVLSLTFGANGDLVFESLLMARI
jgi:hypothetical protein